MDKYTAETIAKKARALKHCNKLLTEIDKKGSARISLNCTGVEFIVHKDDAVYLKLKTIRAQLTEDIESYNIVCAATTQPECPVDERKIVARLMLTDEEKLARRREKRRIYQQRYLAKRKAKLELLKQN